MNSITDHDFVFLEKETEDFYGVKLKTGKWKGVQFIYGSVSIKETPELDTATMSFTYNLTDCAQFEESELKADMEFKNHLGDILQYVIKDSLDNKGARIGHIDTNTNSHTESPNQ